MTARELIEALQSLGEEQDKERFWKDALGWEQPDGWDSAGFTNFS